MKLTPVLLAALLFTSIHAVAQTTAPAPAPAAVVPVVALPPQKADVAAEKFGPDGKVNPGFIAAHERFVKLAAEGKAKLVFLGDSITAGWGKNQAIWDKAFGAYTPVNFGIGGDRTQHVLWRITHGELDGIAPKAVVLMIGTNNTRDNTAEEIAKGVTAIVETIRTKQPQAKILLLAVFPRGDKPDGKLGASNDKLVQVNNIIAKLDDGKSVVFRDIGPRFSVTDGALSAAEMPDFLHLSPAGYEIWADAIAPTLGELMQ